MLCLPEKISSNDSWIGGLVSDDRNFGRPRQEVDPDSSEQLAFCFCHIGIAGTHDHVDRFDVFDSEGQGCERLNSPEAQDLIRSAPIDRVELRKEDALRIPRRCCRHHAIYSGDLRRCHRHDGRGDQRIHPAGAVGPHGFDGNMTMAEHHPGKGFHLEFEHRLQLTLREPAYLLPCLLDVFCELIIDRRAGLLHFGCIHGEACRAPLVVPLGESSYRAFSLSLHRRQDVTDGVFHLACDGFRLRETALEKFRHWS